jgi:hypothetical protein
MHATDTELIQIRQRRRNADSACRRNHQPGRQELYNQRDPADPAVDDPAQGQAGKRYGPGRVESIA